MFRQLFALALTLAALFAAPMEAQSSEQRVRPVTLTVLVTNLHNNAGQVFVQLWNAPDGFPKEANKASRYVVIDGSTIVNGTATATFRDVAPGTYAVSTLHDENKNGKMDNNLLGLPKEGWAVSNNIVTHTHAPSFGQASFQLGPEHTQVSVAMHY